MKVVVIYLLLFLVLQLLTLSTGVKILFFFGFSTHSHRILVWPLVEKLVELGHDITFYQAIDRKIIKNTHPKVFEFYPTSLQSRIDSIEPKLLQDSVMLKIRIEKGRQGVLETMWDWANVSIEYCRHLLENDEFHELIRSKKFDLLIIDAVLNECGLGIAYKLNSRVILLSTFNVGAWHSEIFGFFPEASWVPDSFSWTGNYPMGFYERFANTINPPMMSYMTQRELYPHLENVLRQRLNIPEMPPIRFLEQNLIDLVLVNTHFSEDYPRALPPIFRSISGLHCSWAWKGDLDLKAGPNIPQDIDMFINEAGDNGFIYISFGSALKISESPVEIQEKFFNALAKRKEKFIWKWEGERPKDMPQNVITANWLPQQKILSRRPKIFITHGGLLSIQEAIINAIPLILFPVFADQDYNSYKIQILGRGIRLEISEFTSKNLNSAIDQILSNETYAANMKILSEIFKDRPLSPLDEAIWWTNYTLRNDRNKTQLLRSKYALDQSWIQRRGIDVWFTLFCGIATVFLILLTTLVACFKIFVRFTKPQEKFKRK